MPKTGAIRLSHGAENLCLFCAMTLRSEQSERSQRYMKSITYVLSIPGAGANPSLSARLLIFTQLKIVGCIGPKHYAFASIPRVQERRSSICDCSRPRRQRR
jgi:hypothetical protein